MVRKKAVITQRVDSTDSDGPADPLTEFEMNSSREEIFTCPNCNEDFEDEEFQINHMKICGTKPSVLFTPGEKRSLEDGEEDSDASAPPPKMQLMNGMDESSAARFGDNYEHLDNERSSQFSEKSEVMSDEMKNTADSLGSRGVTDAMVDGEEDDDGIIEDDIEDDIDDLDLDEEKVSSSMSSGDLAASLGAFPPPSLVTNDSNVKLEKLESTKVAVAQFAENNMANLPQMDLPSLQNMLVSLHQQQMMQLQLLQQLQNQLVTGMSPSLAAMGAAAAAAASHPMMLPLLPSSQISGASSSSAPKASSTSNSTPQPNKDTTPKPFTASLPASLAGEPKSMEKGASSSSDSQASSNCVGNGGTVLDRSQYVADDPFFKHKCKFCHKVFGSDSGLQIHVRSHTGERPFKCNICGNRFSTRGNLKVHFERHKAKYPHVKMNPNPVPEHLDPQSQPPPLIPAQSANFIKEEDSGIKLAAPSLSSPQTGQPVSATKDAVVRSNHDDTNVPFRPVPPKISMNSPVPASASPALKSNSNETSQKLSSPTASPLNPLVPPAMPGLRPPKMPEVPSFLMQSMPPPFPAPGMVPPFGIESSLFPRPSILPNKTQEDDSMEQYMEVDKSETSKLEALVQNIETKLTDPNQCAICHRVLSCKSALQMHYRTHTGERPFRCKICGRAFTTKGNLKTHMGVHRAKPPVRMMHQCPVCHKQFTNSLVLQQHIRMHTGELPKDIQLPDGLPPPPTPPSGFMPFPGFPFLPMGFPSPGMPPMMTPNGELDMRKMQEIKKLQEEQMKSFRDQDNPDGADNAEYDDFEDDYEDNKSGDEEKDLGEKQQDNEESTSRLTPEDNEEKEKEKEDPTALYSHSSSMPAVSQSGFSTSLMALEDSVKAIEGNSAISQYNSIQPLQHMTNSFRDHVKMEMTSPQAKLSLENTPENRSSPRSMDSGASPNISSPSISPGVISKPGIGRTDFALGSLDMPPEIFGTNGKQNTTCSVCFKTFACKSALEIHFRSHTKERPFRCDVCDRGFTTKGNMKQHMLTHKIRDLPDRAFNSDNSNSSTGHVDSDADSNDNSPVSEASSHSPVSSISSLPAQAVATSLTASAPQAVPAKTSPISFPPGESTNNITPPSSSSALSKPDSPFIKRPNLRHVCSMCDKPFSSASALQIHIRTHTGDKPFKCQICGKAFTTKGNLKVHMGTHMWNNSPSRRGRRMSIDTLPPNFPGMPPAGDRKPDFFPGFPHPRMAEMYPFPAFPGFPNGFSTPPAPPKMNEISVIQSVNGTMGFPASLANSLADSMAKSNMIYSSSTKNESSEKDSDSKPISETNNNNELNKTEPISGNSGELDLSIRKSSPATTIGSPPATVLTSPPQAHQLPLTAQSMMSPPLHTSLAPKSPHTPSGWLWKTTCHICHQVFPTEVALEAHVKTHIPHKEHASQSPVMT